MRLGPSRTLCLLLALLPWGLGVAACEIKQPVPFQTLQVGPLLDNDFFSPVPLPGSDAVVLRSAGPDEAYRTNDDELIIVGNLATSPQITRVTVPYLSPSSLSRPVPLSGTLLVVGTATDDPTISLLVTVQIASDPADYTVTINGTDVTINVPVDCPPAATITAAEISLCLSVAINSAPVPATAIDRMGSVGLVEAPAGPALTVTTSTNLSVGVFAPTFGQEDDALAIVSGLATTTPTVSFVQVGPLTESEASRPVVISATSVLVTVGGDFAGSVNPAFGTDDDGIVVVSGLPGSPVATYADIDTSAGNGYLSTTALSRPEVLDADTALVGSGGSDKFFGDLTDRIYLIQGLAGGSPTANTAIDAGTLSESAASRPLALASSPDLRALVSVGGTDGNFGNADDKLSLIYAVGATNTVFTVGVPGLGQGPVGRAVRVSDAVALLPGMGPDLKFSSSDDQINIICNLATSAPIPASNPSDPCAAPGSITPTGEVRRQALTVGNLAGTAVASPVPISAARAFVPTAGIDNVFANTDDALILLDGLDATPSANPGPTLGVPLTASDSRPQLFPSAPLKLLIRGSGAFVYALDDPLGLSLGPQLNIVEVTGPTTNLATTGPEPVAVLTNLAVSIARGPDQTWGTQDDSLVLIRF